MKKYLLAPLSVILAFCMICCLSINANGVVVDSLPLGDSSFSIDFPPAFPSNGQQFWIVFREGYRNSRIEMSTCNSLNDPNSLWIKWNRNLTLQGGYVSGQVNQYYLNSNNEWQQIGTYGIFSDYATEVIASNLDVYDGNNRLIMKGVSSYPDSSLKAERIMIGTKTNYYGAANYESSKAGEVQDAAIEFKDKLVSYYNAFCSEGQKKIGNTNSLISLDDLAKQLRKQDESTSDKYITMIDSNVTSDCLDSVYYALADFLTNVVNNNVDLGSIDFSKDSITNAAKIVNAVKNGMRSSGKTQSARVIMKSH